MRDRPTVPPSSSQALSTIKMRNSYATRNNDMFGILGFLLREPPGRPLADRHLRFFHQNAIYCSRSLSLQRFVRDADLFVESQSWKLSLAKQNAWTQRWVEIYDNYSPKFRKVSVAVGGSLKHILADEIEVLEPLLSRWQWLHLHKKMWKIVAAPLEIRCELAAGKLQFLLSKLIAFSWQRLMNLRSLWMKSLVSRKPFGCVSSTPFLAMMSRLRRRMRRYNHNPCDCNQISETETVPSTIDPSKRPWKSRTHNGGVHHLHPSPTAKNYLLQSGSHQLSREQYERHERPNKNSESNQDKR